MNRNNKQAQFNSLVKSVNECTLCKRMCDRVKVLSSYNGNIDTKVLFIAEAPGRLGADKTAIPMFGDRSGENFNIFLENIGWSRSDIFITNAVICNPRNEKGNNDKPNIIEIENCSFYLEMVINLINPQIVVTLGAVALDSLSHIFEHNYKLKEDVGKLLKWNGYKLMPLYHPAPRALIHRNLDKQRSDYIGLANIIHPIKGIKNKKFTFSTKTTNSFSKFELLILIIMHLQRNISYFKLTKLLYLIDWWYISNKGESFSKETYIRQKDGPWPPALKRTIPSLITQGFFKKNYINKLYTLELITLKDVKFNSNELNEIAEIIKNYKEYDNHKMKFCAYRTEPMRFIIEKERSGANFLNRPVLIGDKSILNL